jgi:hypothetical protein
MHYKKDVDSQVTGSRLARWVCRKATLLLRGESARTRISLLVLCEYVFSLILVGVSAIVFWAILIKAANPMSLSLSSCLRVSISYFLPGMKPPDLSGDLPLWAAIGPAATAWVLFVLYIGPAGSLLPERQKASIRSLVESYGYFRTLVLRLRADYKRMMKLKESLPD